MLVRCLPSESVATNREIRAHLGRRLREHYRLAQQIPLPERLAEIAKHFGQPIGDLETKPENRALPDIVAARR
jgi:hypothetical protein